MLSPTGISQDMSILPSATTIASVSAWLSRAWMFTLRSNRLGLYCFNYTVRYRLVVSVAAVRTLDPDRHRALLHAMHAGFV
jgi:hypothetical protein